MGIYDYCPAGHWDEDEEHDCVFPAGAGLVCWCGAPAVSYLGPDPVCDRCGRRAWPR